MSNRHFLPPPSLIASTRSQQNSAKSNVTKSVSSGTCRSASRGHEKNA